MLPTHNPSHEAEMKVCGASQNPMFCTNLTAAPSSHPAYVNICLIFFFKIIFT